MRMDSDSFLLGPYLHYPLCVDWPLCLSYRTYSTYAFSAYASCRPCCLHFNGDRDTALWFKPSRRFVCCVLLLCVLSVCLLGPVLEDPLMQMQVHTHCCHFITGVQASRMAPIAHLPCTARCVCTCSHTCHALLVVSVPAPILAMHCSLCLYLLPYLPCTVRCVCSILTTHLNRPGSTSMAGWLPFKIRNTL